MYVLFSTPERLQRLQTNDLPFDFAEITHGIIFAMTVFRIPVFVLRASRKTNELRKTLMTANQAAGIGFWDYQTPDGFFQWQNQGLIDTGI